MDEDGKWFNNLTLSGEMGKLSRDFQLFAELNKDKDICFVISLERGEKDWHKQVNFELILFNEGAVVSKGGDSVNFHFAPENTSESTPQSTPESKNLIFPHKLVRGL